MCNRIIDCLDGSDEIFCSYPSLAKISRVCQQNLVFSLICNFWNKNNNISGLTEGLIRYPEELKKIELIGKEITVKNVFDKREEWFQLNILVVKENDYFSKIKNHFINLIYLDLENCKITFQSPIINKPMKGLENLLISKNYIGSLKFLRNLKPINLLNLDISFSKITIIEKEILKFLKNLEKLNLKNSLIKSLESLYHLKLRNLVQLNNINENLPVNLVLKLIQSSNNLDIIFTQNYHICCIIYNNLKLSSIKCEIEEKSLKTCSNLIGNLFEKFIIWLIIIFSIMANIFHILILVFSQKKIHKLTFLTIIHDLCFLTYIIIITTVDLYYGDKFLERFEFWVKTTLCQSLGFIYSLALLIDSWNSFLQSLQGLLIIKYPFKLPFISKYESYFTFITFFFSFFLSAIPLIFNPVSSDIQTVFLHKFYYFFENFHGDSSVCIYIMIRNKKPFGWIFAFIIWTILLSITNFLTFLIWLKMIDLLKKGNKKTGKLKKDQRKNLKITFGAVKLLNNFIWLIFLSLGEKIPKKKIKKKNL